ncbi:MAG TPA: hypothetical protein VF676_12390 [Flavobacterium sp.]|jgi:hypothetical protein
MKNLKFLLVASLFAILGISCERDAQTQSDASAVSATSGPTDQMLQRGVNLRADFLRGKTHTQAVAAYNLLGEEDQKTYG